jgi:histone deacetylase HOS2
MVMALLFLTTSSVNPRQTPDTSLTEKFLGSKEHTDCPIFDGMWNYFRLYTGASLDGARNLLSNQSDIAINWSGGLHHAHKGYAAGFCYINDIVLAIQQLLLLHTRVLYIDIDVHHGDGVEEAFHSTDRVLTLSFHRYGPEFFPGTGAMDETGPSDRKNPGAHHSLNVPINEGITDDQWTRMFKQIVNRIMEVYDPSAVVLQCGADSLGGDRLGNFNLNIKAHGFCVEFVKQLCHNRKLLIIGGGGYTPRNVARCWTHETALCVGAKLRQEIPAHVPYRQAFTGPENGNAELYPEFDNVNSPQKIHENKNSDEYLQSQVENIYEQLRFMQGAPSVEMRYIPDGYLKLRQEEDDRLRDHRVDLDNDELARRRLERNIAGRNELRDP